jgi:hypothetical protein
MFGRWGGRIGVGPVVWLVCAQTCNERHSLQRQDKSVEPTSQITQFSSGLSAGWSNSVPHATQTRRSGLLGDEVVIMDSELRKVKETVGARDFDDSRVAFQAEQ